MPPLPDILPGLRTFSGGGADGGVSGRLRRLPASGANPGALDGWFHVPEATAAVPLVVVLHGCTQTAAGYDRGSGWSDLAARHGFAVLFPEQRRANNPNLCFNWFQPGDVARDGGEVLSIRQMIAALSERNAIDPRRVFVTGLSAGGAMANAMLATWPELFAGGSIVAGLPYGAASSVSQAMERMRGAGLAGEADHAALVRRASAHRGPWPTVSVWHGDADRTVDVANADAIVGQWRVIHGARAAPDRVEVVDGQRHRVWLGSDGREAVDDYRIAGLGHGTPLATRGPDGCGVAGAYMIEAGISSTRRQAERWGLLRAAPAQAAGPVPIAGATPPVRATGAPILTTAPDAAGVTGTIERALRSAGLMR